ncbi:hypothetical protein FNH22_31230 [Fulvivirga sp. M361]|uniref:hypothetical protein n=1 Tax=Fulvivirga sp. M361 TaxID=2594266 RepID=UPI00117B24A5|nr:hypothetical protein [Fulvivirga sp. M361]TRX45894.1 hypothetical protein FNH22_31230 [Fulvivirga sp. M361]
MMEITKDQLLQFSIQIVQQHFSKTKTIGLMHGKMGIALSLYHAQSLVPEIPMSQPDDLIDEVYQNVNNHPALDFAEGLGGIGWGLMYALKQKFVAGDADELLVDLDKKFNLSLIYKKPHRLCLSDGMAGYGFYFLSRIQVDGGHEEHFATITNKYCLEKIVQELELLLTNQSYSIPEPDDFSLFWDLPVLLFLLGECIAENVRAKVVTGMAEKIIRGIGDKPSLRASSRLLLSLALKYFHLRTGINFEIEGCTVKTSSDHEICEELHDRFSINGLAGIALLYHIIYQLNGDPEMRQQAELWLHRAGDALGYIQASNKETLLSENLGLANGISGFILAYSILKTQKMINL